MTFDAIPGSVQELDCVLVFDEDTKASSMDRIVYELYAYKACRPLRLNAP